MSTYSEPSFSSSAWKIGGVLVCKLGVKSQERLKIGLEVKLLLSANGKVIYAVLIGTTTDGLEWP